MKFIIVAPGYDDNAGGTVVLHQLCDRLNKLGYEASLWPIHKPVFDRKNLFKTFYRFIRYFRKTVKYGYKKNPLLDTPNASSEDLKEGIIVYPEVVLGNPLKAQHVVRWLLHKPGFNNGGKIEFGSDDLFFFYDRAFDDRRYNPFPENLLHIVSQRSGVYRVTNTGKREGSCYLLRKGYKRTMVHDTKDSILIDGLSHEETAKVFNAVEYCLFYDTYTMYTVYAAMCGCIPVVVPEAGVSKEEWQPNEENRYGIAYGFEDRTYAIETRPLLLERLKKQEKESDESVERFVQKCKGYWAIKN